MRAICFQHDESFQNMGDGSLKSPVILEPEQAGLTGYYFNT
jgi:hypothetical protein